VIAIEAKSHLTVRDVRVFRKALDRFFEFFPEYRNAELVGAVVGVRLSRGAASEAIDQGMFVFAPSGDTVRLLNDEGFRPRVLAAPGITSTASTT
jgi:hypothetical protein